MIQQLKRLTEKLIFIFYSFIFFLPPPPPPLPRLLQKIFCIWSSNAKKPILTSIIFLSLFFHLMTYTNPNTLTDAKQWTLTLLLFLLFRPFGPHNHRTTQNIYHANHRANDDHHNSHHVTSSSTPL